MTVNTATTGQSGNPQSQSNLVKYLLAALGIGGATAGGMGAFGSSFKDFLIGTPGKYQPMTKLTPEQQNVAGSLYSKLNQYGTSGMDYYNKILSGDTSQFEAPLMRQFNEQVVPGLAERFTKAGAGAQQSSAFGQQMGAAGSGLMESLGALRGKLGMQAAEGMRGYMGMGLEPTFENLEMGGTEGMLPLLAKIAAAYYSGGF